MQCHPIASSSSAQPPTAKNPHPSSKKESNTASPSFAKEKHPSSSSPAGAPAAPPTPRAKSPKPTPIAQGISSSSILKETTSRTTHQNFTEAKTLMDQAGLKTAIIVSDPLHLKRAAAMAKDLGISAVTSPTPTSRYQSLRPKLGFLLREIFFYNFHLLTGH